MKNLFIAILFLIGCKKPTITTEIPARLSNVAGISTSIVYKMYKTSDHVTVSNRDGTKTMQIGNYLYSFGAWTADGAPKVYNDVYRSTDSLNTWTQIANAPWAGRHTFGIAQLSDKTYIFGGDAYNPTMDYWLTYTGTNWYYMGLMPCAQRILYGSCSDGVYMYVIGGLSNYNQFRSSAHDVWRSDGNGWIKVGDGIAAFERNLAGAAVCFNRKIYVVSGGVYGTGTGTLEMYSSSDKGATWERETDLPFTGRQYLDCISWDGKLWVIGGYNFGNLRDIWYMDEYGMWTQFTGVPADYIGRHATGLAVFNGKLVITNGNYNNDCWVIEKI